MNFKSLGCTGHLHHLKAIPPFFRLNKHTAWKKNNNVNTENDGLEHHFPFDYRGFLGVHVYPKTHWNHHPKEDQ